MVIIRKVLKMWTIVNAIPFFILSNHRKKYRKKQSEFWSKKHVHDLSVENL